MTKAEEGRTPESHPDPIYWNEISHIQFTMTRYQRYQIDRGFGLRRELTQSVSNKKYTLTDWIRDLIAADIAEFGIDMGDPPIRGGHHVVEER